MLSFMNIYVEILKVDWWFLSWVCNVGNLKKIINFTLDLNFSMTNIWMKPIDLDLLVLSHVVMENFNWRSGVALTLSERWEDVCTCLNLIGLDGGVIPGGVSSFRNCKQNKSLIGACVKYVTHAKADVASGISTGSLFARILVQTCRSMCTGVQLVSVCGIRTAVLRNFVFERWGFLHVELFSKRQIDYLYIAVLHHSLTFTIW